MLSQETEDESQRNSGPKVMFFNAQSYDPAEYLWAIHSLRAGDIETNPGPEDDKCYWCEKKTTGRGPRCKECR